MKLEQFKILIRYFKLVFFIYIYLLIFGITSHIKKVLKIILERKYSERNGIEKKFHDTSQK